MPTRLDVDSVVYVFPHLLPTEEHYSLDREGRPRTTPGYEHSRGKQHKLAYLESPRCIEIAWFCSLLHTSINFTKNPRRTKTQPNTPICFQGSPSLFSPR